MSGQTSPRTIQGSLRMDPSRVPKTSQDSPPTDENRRPVGPSTPRLWGIVHWYLFVREERLNTSLNPRPRTNRTVCWSRVTPSMFLRLWGLSLACIHCKLRGEIVTSKKEKLYFLMVLLGILNMFISLKHLEDFILQNQNLNSLRNSLELHWSQNSRKGLD